MFEARRPRRRLFFLLVGLLVTAAQAQTPATTTVNDTVYRADGTPAGGELLIFWPAFTTATGQAVAAGNTTVTLGAGGALSVALVPNVNATPANTVYRVVYQLDDNTSKTEYWIIPTTSPTTIAAVRTTLGSEVSAEPPATQQYVNAALAGKANDNAVVHLSGTETITGTKQFSVSPTLPAPTTSAAAATKGYVDSAVTNAGSGSYVSIAGGTMTGPLQLPGDPASPSQAADKHYVDAGLATKADLVSGTVPTAELGSGTANNGVCLHGDSTWGGCGSSSNAVSIQGVPVSTTAPTDNQVITYVAALGQYQPKPGGGVTAGMQAVKYAPDFSWSQSPSANLSTPGAATVSLAACPAGVTGSEPQYYVYVAGTGTAEAVLVTGGTCAGNGQAGTLQFTTANAHPSGYTVGSASGGLQEALIASRFTPTNPNGTSQSGKVIVSPGEFKAYARVSVRSSNITVDFSGSIVECWMSDTCVYVGDPSNPNLFSDITLIGPRGRPTIANGQFPFIEVNAQKTRIFNVSTRLALNNGTFSSFVQVDGDQAFLLDGLDTTLGGGSGDYGVECNATICNPVVYAPGPFASNAAVGWLKNLNISLQCSGNGVDWQSGNTLRISDSVIQGFAQYGVRAGTARGGFGGFELENVYQEIGNCVNPAGPIGQAGVIAQGATVKIDGGEAPAGAMPQFANTGSTSYHYYVVAHNTTLGASNPLYAGTALSNGSGSITVTTPDIAGANTFDLLRVTPPASGPEQAPYGTGNYAVVTGVSRSSACVNGVCTFTDSQNSLQPYTVANPNYFPLLTFWPGSLVLGTSQDTNSALYGARAWVQSAPSAIVAVQGNAAPAVISTNCDALNVWTPVWLSCYSTMSPAAFYNQGAFLMSVKPNADGNTLLNLKGRMNFTTLGTAPGHIITLSDSNLQKTIATANNRPTNDANDAFLGYDQGDGNPAHIGVSLGAPISLSNYIANVGDGQNWLERLTSNLKEFKTNVQMDNSLTVAGTIQANQFVSTGSGGWNVTGNFAALNPAAAGKSEIGFGSNGKLQVSENGGAVVEVAKLDVNGNFAGNAVTASALAAIPTQCSGSFATGIQANGNANCSTADLIELAETTAPAGIANYGIFWFDQTCHCPKVIDNNGQAVQLGLTNVFNSDALGTNVANVVEERNGTNPQALRVFNTYTSSSAWDFFGMDYDSTNARYRIWSNDASSGAPGIEFQIQGTVPWYISSNLNLLTGTDNLRDVGADTLGIRNLFFGSFLDGETGGALVTEMANASTTGTTLNALAKLTGAPSTAVIASTSDTGGVLGVVNTNAGTTCAAGTTGKACIVTHGPGTCKFDNAVTAGDYVQISSTTAGDCHDAGSSYPTSGQVLGRVLVTNANSGTYTAYFYGSETQGAGGGSGNVNGPASSTNNDFASFNGTTGKTIQDAGVSASSFSGTGSCSNKVVTAVNGNAAPTCTTITSAYVDSSIATSASPALTGAPTAPTPATSDNSTKVATTAYVQAQGYATLASPALTGTPTAPTPTAGDNSTKIATTAFVTSTCLWTTYPTTSGTGNTLSSSSNKATLWKVWLPAPCSTGAVTYDIGTADNTSNTYDLGLYNSSGTLMVHLGSTAGTTFSPSAGVKDASWTASAVLPAGIYYIALTSSCTSSCATLAGSSSNAIARETNTTVSVSSGGTLSSTVTPPADVSSGGAQIPAVIVR